MDRRVRSAAGSLPRSASHVKIACYFKRFLSDAELARLGTALTEAEAEGMNPTAVAAVRLLLLTGMRRGEVLGLCRPDIAADGASLRLREAKAGPLLGMISARQRNLCPAEGATIG